jgi:hypothetical protein
MQRVSSLLLTTLLAAGCTSYRPTAPLPAPATTVRVTFLSPRDVVARTPGGDSVVLYAVREMSGSIVRAQLDTRLDSLRVRLGAARNASRGISGIPEGAIVTVPREPFVRVEQKSVDPVKTLKVVALVAGIVVLAGVLLIAVAASEGPMY